jgi:hypothetical protein
MDREFSSRVIEALEDLNPPDGLENAIELQQRDSALEASESHKAILRTLAERRNVLLSLFLCHRSRARPGRKLRAIFPKNHVVRKARRRSREFIGSAQLATCAVTSPLVARVQPLAEKGRPSSIERGLRTEIPSSVADNYKSRSPLKPRPVQRIAILKRRP